MNLDLKESNKKQNVHFTKIFFGANIPVRLNHMKLLIFDCFELQNGNFILLKLTECIYFMIWKVRIILSLHRRLTNPSMHVPCASHTF